VGYAAYWTITKTYKILQIYDLIFLSDSRCFILGLFFGAEEEGEMFLVDVG
jgi:hypothetical protein